MNTFNPKKRSANQDTALLKKLLGSLELEAMECMWKMGVATVRQVVTIINGNRSIAYTSVMTVMSHLVDKRLLSRSLDGKRYIYTVVLDREEFIQSVSRKMVHALVEDFGDIAIAQFLGEVDNLDPEKLDQLKKLAREADSENSPSE